METQRTITPVDGTVYVERELASEAVIDAALVAAVDAQRRWKAVAPTRRAHR